MAMIHIVCLGCHTTKKKQKNTNVDLNICLSNLTIGEIPIDLTVRYATCSISIRRRPEIALLVYKM